MTYYGDRPHRWTRLGCWLTAACLTSWACGDTGGVRVLPLQAPSAGAPQSADPALAVEPASGDLVLGWIEGDGPVWGLYTARSADGGEHWSSPVHVAGGSDAPGEVHPHGESSPRLVIGPGGRMALVWPNSLTVPGRKWPATMLRFARSGDGGRSWSRPVTLNDDTTGAPVSHQFHGAAWVGDSGLAVAWLDEREVNVPITGGTDGHASHAVEPDATIYLTTSSNFGRTWGPNRVGWNGACPCCRVTLARNPEGKAVAAWRKHFPGNVRDVVTAVVSEQPTEPERVHRDDWVYAGCPHSGPAMTVAGDGSTHVVWYNGKQGAAGVYYARQAGGKSTGPAVSLVGGQALGVAHPAVAALPQGGALAAYDVSPGGERRIRLAHLRPDGRIATQVEIEGSEDGKYPHLAVIDSTSAVLGWTESIGDRSVIRVARITLR